MEKTFYESLLNYKEFVSENQEALISYSDIIEIRKLFLDVNKLDIDEIKSKSALVEDNRLKKYYIELLIHKYFNLLQKEYPKAFSSMKRIFPGASRDDQIELLMQSQEFIEIMDYREEIITNKMLIAGTELAKIFDAIDKYDTSIQLLIAMQNWYVDSSNIGNFLRNIKINRYISNNKYDEMKLEISKDKKLINKFLFNDIYFVNNHPYINILGFAFLVFGTFLFLHFLSGYLIFVFIAYIFAGIFFSITRKNSVLFQGYLLKTVQLVLGFIVGYLIYLSFVI